MATTRRLIELFRSIAADDFTSAKGLAAQICQTEEQRGHRSAARQLRGALGANGHNGNSRQLNGLPISGMALASGALMRLPTDVSMDDLVLPSRSRQELREIVLEWKHRARLQEKAIRPRSRLLFHGPPGCGKSVTARALGKQLDLPAYLVRFDAVIGAYLGQTAIHLRQLFHFAEVTPCVLLLDELDALGKRRGNPLDVGELDRIVISLMQELEHSKPAGLIIATSNLAQHLDGALWRRFDLTLKFPAPTSATLCHFCKRVAKTLKITVPVKVLRRAMAARSLADAEAEIVGEARRQVLRKL